MLNLIAVFVGGGAGAALRWIACTKIPHHFGTFAVNVLGAFFIGVLYQYISGQDHFPPVAKAFLMTGLLGGFTTFSTYMLDFVTLLQAHRMGEAVIYLIISIILGVACLIFGMKVAAFIG